MPQIQHREQEPKSVKCKIPCMLRIVICQHVGKFWIQALTRSKESTTAESCPVIRKFRPPLVFINPGPLPWGGVGSGSKRNILMA